MSDDPSSSGESRRYKLTLFIVDKVIIAALFVYVGHLLSDSLQTRGKGIDYQQKLFDKRVDAYLEVLQTAKEATDSMELLWTSSSGTVWSRRYDGLEQRWNALSTGMSGSSTWSDVAEVVGKLRKVERSWSKQSLHFGREVSAAVANYLDVTYKDLEAELARIEYDRKAREGSASTGAKPLKIDDREAWNRARAAYENLDKTIREKLKVDGIILG